MKTLKIVGVVVAVLVAGVALLFGLGVPGGFLADAVRGRIEAAGNTEGEQQGNARHQDGEHQARDLQRLHG